MPPTVYTLNDERLSVHIRPRLPWKWWKYEKKKFYPWSSILSYSIGEDMTRGLEKFHYIRLEIRGIANDLKISDNAKYLTGFEEFKKAFIEMVDERNERIEGTKIAAGVKSSSTGAEPAGKQAAFSSGEKPIQRKRSFYERPLAKAVTLLFLSLIIGICVFYIYNPDFFRWEHFFRISFVLIPGIGYMFYKSFLEKRK